MNLTVLPVYFSIFYLYNYVMKFDNNTVYILDSYGLIFRCYFAFIKRPLTNPNGDNISALFGFFRNLHHVFQHYKPGCLVAAMDSKTKTFRHDFYPEYKATRNKTPEDLHAQIPWICDILTALGVPVLQCDGYEADDIIATVARKCEESGRTCRILSGDKDLMQLVDESTQIMKPEAGSTWKVTGIEGVEAEWGVKPAQLLDLLSLYGDTADNIPGVKGVGVKTASKLLGEYGDLDGIYAHIDEVKGAMQKKLIDGKDMAYFSQKLVRLCDSVPCCNIDEAIGRNDYVYNYADAAELLKNFGAPAVAKQYAELAVEAAGGDAATMGGGNATVGGNSPSGAGAGSPASGVSSATKELAAKNEKLKNIIEEDVGSEPLEVHQNKGNYRAITDVSDLSDFIDKAIEAGTVAYDSETDSLNTITANIIGFSLCYKSGEAVFVPVSHPSDDLFAENKGMDKAQAFSQLARLFTADGVNIVFHNAKFDLKVLISNGFLAENGAPGAAGSAPGAGGRTPGAGDSASDVFDLIKASIHDTMVATWILTPDRPARYGYSLEYLGETVLGLKGIEFTDIVPKGMTFGDIDLEKAVPYASEDADFTFQLWKVFEPKLKENENLWKVYSEIEMKVLPILANMELTGIHLDSAALNHYNQELTEGIAASEKAIYDEVGHEFNISSPKQLQEVLFEERHLKPGKKTKTGYSTDTSVLESLAHEDPVPKMILEYRELAKLQSTYVETLPQMVEKDNRIHTDFVQTGTATGRLSCREPNLQNIPVRNEAGRRIRSAFTAPEGKVLISADYAQIELVVLAHLSQDKNMCQAFIDGTDVHRSTAALIFGVAPDDVTPDMRRTAKVINFGVIYGMSAFRLAQDLEIPRTQAAAFIDNYFKMYSSVNDFITETVSKAEQTGYVETICGRRRKIMNINSRNKVEKNSAERVAVNTPVQGSAADIVKLAMINVSNGLKEAKSPAKILLQVHDELIFECPDDEKIIQDTIALIKDKMENAVKLSVPLRVSIEYGKNWGEFH